MIKTRTPIEKVAKLQTPSVILGNLTEDTKSGLREHTMRTISPFLVGIMIVSVTTIGVAHVLGNDGALVTLANHFLDSITDWVADLIASLFRMFSE